MSDRPTMNPGGSAIDWQIQPGPCVVCGERDYPLSLGGPGLCPACDCYPPERRIKDIVAIRARYREALMKIAAGPNGAPGSEPWSRAEAMIALGRDG